MNDYYSNFKEFCSDLEKHGFKKCGDEIDDIINNGCISGEIFMGIKWVIKRFLEEEKNAPFSIRRKSLIIIDEINKTGI